MVRFHLFGALNDDQCSVMEEKYESSYTVSSGPNPYTVIVMDSGTTYQVKETLEEVENAIKAGKESSQAKS
jgi:uncharacterized protein YlzI (FlbEa/FlbD family)